VAALVGEEDGSEQRAADVLRLIGAANADRVKSVAYHLNLVCDARKRATEARDFNTLIVAWPTIERLVADRRPAQETRKHTIFSELGLSPEFWHLNDPN